MKQAGEGADFLEGCEGTRSQRCFKCGAAGHWAAECRGFEVLLPLHVNKLTKQADCRILEFRKYILTHHGTCSCHNKRSCGCLTWTQATVKVCRPMGKRAKCRRRRPRPGPPLLLRPGLSASARRATCGRRKAATRYT